MVVRLENGSWKYRAKKHANILFVSASSPDEALLTITVNGDDLDEVYLKVPHSWWPMSGQRFPTLAPKDELVVIVKGTASVRIDLEEFE